MVRSHSMATSKGKHLDGRANNGSVSQGLSEDAVLVRGPASLLQAMRDHAKANGQPASYVWRKAAELFLSHDNTK